MKTQPMDNSEPLGDGFNFTPLFRGGRVRMRVGEYEASVLPWKGSGFRGFVTDTDTGKRYRVYGRPCGLGCYCDAEIEECR